MKTFLINLERSQDRLAQAKAQLDQASIPFERIEAVDGTALDQSAIASLDQVKATSMFTHPLRAGEIGCYLSHLRAVEHIVELELPYALVLEDDFAFKPLAQLALAKLEQSLTAGQVKNWDVINLGNNARKILRPLITFNSGTQPAQLCRAFYFPVTTTGLIWSHDGARRFLRDAGHIYEPVDGTLQRLMCKSGRGLAFRQSLVMANGAESVISPANAQETAMQDAGFGFRMRRYVNAMARFIRGPEAL